MPTSERQDLEDKIALLARRRAFITSISTYLNGAADLVSMWVAPDASGRLDDAADLRALVAESVAHAGSRSPRWDATGCTPA